MKNPPCEHSSWGRGTAEGGGGAKGSDADGPSTMLRMVPLPIASRQGGTYATVQARPSVLRLVHSCRAWVLDGVPSCRR